MALDSFEMASCFNDEFTDDVTAQIRLYGTGPALTSEEEITEYLEGAAAVCQIYSGYGIIKKKEKSKKLLARLILEKAID